MAPARDLEPGQRAGDAAGFRIASTLCGQRLCSWGAVGTHQVGGSACAAAMPAIRVQPHTAAPALQTRRPMSKHICRQAKTGELPKRKPATVQEPLGFRFEWHGLISARARSRSCRCGTAPGHGRSSNRRSPRSVIASDQWRWRPDGARPGLAATRSCSCVPTSGRPGEAVSETLQLAPAARIAAASRHYADQQGNRARWCPARPARAPDAPWHSRTPQLQEGHDRSLHPSFPTGQASD